MTGYRIQTPGPVPTTSSWWCGDDVRQGTSVCGSELDLLVYLWGRAPQMDGRVILACEGEECGVDADAEAQGAPVLMAVETATEATGWRADVAMTILRALDSADAWWGGADYAPGAINYYDACERAVTRIQELRETAARRRDADALRRTRLAIRAIRAVQATI